VVVQRAEKLLQRTETMARITVPILVAMSIQPAKETSELRSHRSIGRQDNNLLFHR